MIYRVWDEDDEDCENVVTIESDRPEWAAERYVEERWDDQYEYEKECECYVQAPGEEPVLYVVKVRQEPWFSASRKSIE